MKHAYQFPMVKLPDKADQTLYLIREELKSRKLFHTLHEIGLEECSLQPHLDRLILSRLGLTDDDETFARYDRILDKRCKKIGMDSESVTKQALKVYQALLLEKKRGGSEGMV